MTAIVRPYSDAPRLAAGPVTIGSLFADARPRVEIEIGPGRGGFLLERLASRPDVAMLGLEIRRKWARIVDDRLRRAGHGGRARVFAEDARDALARLGPDASVAAVFVHFPDPWWKKRHNKRLVIGSALLDQIARLLVPGGELFVQTDVAERAEAYDALLSAHRAFEARGDVPGSSLLAHNPHGARSHRERRAEEDQIPIHRLRFARRS
jgi:tRNA (guanine-N7-)-methyltransferase